MKIITIVGARPQFIKAAPFSEEFRKSNCEILVHTGQHYDKNMSNIFFDELKIPFPDYNLEVGSGSHGQQTSKMLSGIEEILLIEKPDGVLVYGDTNSTLAGALAASKLNVPVFHVEAGLRSYNKFMPEEQNRILTDHISSLLFCPTKTAVSNLKIENIINNVYNTGDIMYDAIIRNSEISYEKFKNGLTINNFNIESIKNKFFLATIHRAENTDVKENLLEIFKSFNDFKYPVIIPLHPRTKRILMDFNLDFKNIHIIDPVGYLEMIYLIKNSYMVVTDSGGLQKEAYFLNKPCTTLRNQTEWIETLNYSWNELSTINKLDILQHVNRDLTKLKKDKLNYFGDGKTAIKICGIINEMFT